MIIDLGGINIVPVNSHFALIASRFTNYRHRETLVGNLIWVDFRDKQKQHINIGYYMYLYDLTISPAYNLMISDFYCRPITVPSEWQIDTAI